MGASETVNARVEMREVTVDEPRTYSRRARLRGLASASSLARGLWDTRRVSVRRAPCAAGVYPLRMPRGRVSVGPAPSSDSRSGRRDPTSGWSDSSGPGRMVGFTNGRLRFAARRR